MSETEGALRVPGNATFEAEKKKTVRIESSFISLIFLPMTVLPRKKASIEGIFSDLDFLDNLNIV